MSSRSFDLKQYANEAFLLAGPSIEAAIKASQGRNALYVIILDPKIPYEPSLELPILDGKVFGDSTRDKWEKPFDQIACSKARVCWRTGMSSRTVGERAPYLYKEGDTKFPGGVFCDGLVVAASGLDWQLDEACAHMVIAFFWAKVRMARDDAMSQNFSFFV